MNIYFSPLKMSLVLLLSQFMATAPMASSSLASNFYSQFDITWGGDRAKTSNKGKLLTLSLDKASGSGFQSKNQYLFGRTTCKSSLCQGTQLALSLHIVFLVDDTPIRVFKNLESAGVSYPKSQAMRVYGSLWNADDRATRGGLLKTNWTQAPFTASFRNFKADACVWSSASSCVSNSTSLGDQCSARKGAQQQCPEKTEEGAK